jgi:hypothetical protein
VAVDTASLSMCTPTMARGGVLFPFELNVSDVKEGFSMWLSQPSLVVFFLVTPIVFLTAVMDNFRRDLFLAFTTFFVLFVFLELALIPGAYFWSFSLLPSPGGDSNRAPNFFHHD